MANFLFKSPANFGRALTYGEQDVNQHIWTQYENNAIAPLTGLCGLQKSVAGTSQGNPILFSEADSDDSDLGHKQFDMFQPNRRDQTEGSAAVSNHCTQGTDPYDQTWSQRRPEKLYAPTPLQLLPSALPRFLNQVEDLPSPASSILYQATSTCGNLAVDSQHASMPGRNNIHSRLQEATGLRDQSDTNRKYEAVQVSNGEGSSRQRVTRTQNTRSQEICPVSLSPRIQSQKCCIEEDVVSAFEECLLGTEMLERIKVDGQTTFQIRHATVDGKLNFQVQMVSSISTSRAESSHIAAGAEWEARKVLDETNFAGTAFYRVAWKPTWEPESNLKHAPDLLKDWNEYKEARRASRSTAPNKEARRASRSTAPNNGVQKRSWERTRKLA